MFEESAFERLKSLFEEKPLRSEIIRTTGLYEAEVDRLLEEAGLYDEGIEITTLARLSGIDLHVTAGDLDSPSFTEKVEGLSKLFGERVYERGGRSMAEVVLGLLSSSGHTLALAESCTGGLLADRVTNIPGSSLAFLLGVVCYSNEAKINQLGVKKEDIDAHGAVSEPVARAMVRGALRNSRADVAVAVTGIAGPDGGTAEKPVGTVWIAWAWRQGTDPRVVAWRYLFEGDRDAVRRQTAETALKGLIQG